MSRGPFRRLRRAPRPPAEPPRPDPQETPTKAAPGPPLALTRHRDVKLVLGDPDRFTAGRGALDLGQKRPVLPLQAEPAEHGLLRAVLDPVFAPSAIAKHERSLRAHVGRLIDAFPPEGLVEINGAFSRSLPLLALIELLDLPVDDLAVLGGLHDGILGPGASDAPGGRREAGARIYAYLEPHVAARRDESGPDLIRALHQARRDGHPVTEDDIVDTCYLLLLAGIDPVARALATMVACLGSDPAGRAAVVADPTRLRHTIEELLRWGSAVEVLTRLAVEDTTVAGQLVPEGTRLACSVHEANRDGEVFADPDRFDPERATAAHLAFGTGIHRCIGSHLARLQLRIAAEELEGRLPGYRLADPSSVSADTIGARDELWVAVGGPLRDPVRSVSSG